MVGPRQARAFHTGTDDAGRRLSTSEREQMMRPYLPDEPANPTSTTAAYPSSIGSGRHIRFHHKQRVRPAIRQLIHSLIFTIIHTIFSVYIRLRQAYHAIVDRVLAVLYYHHRTPELIQKDVRNLTKLPQHLSVILDLPPEGGKKDRLETVINDACEVAAWSACAGIPMVSVYEKTGKELQPPRQYDTLTMPRHPQAVSASPPPPHLSHFDRLLRRELAQQTDSFPPRPESPLLQPSHLPRSAAKRYLQPRPQHPPTSHNPPPRRLRRPADPCRPHENPRRNVSTSQARTCGY